MRRTTTHRRALLAAFTLLGAWGVPATAQAPPRRILTFVETLKGSEDVELRWPVAVAAASAEELLVADAFKPRLLRFRRVGVSWQLDRTVELPGAPVGLSWDGARYVASLRQGAGLVAFEGPALAQRRLALPRGVVPGPLAAAADGELLVYDYAGGRALRVKRSGEIAASVEIEGAVTALAASATGGFFAAIAAESAVVQYGASGSRDATWKLPAYEQVPAWPVGLAVEPGGDVLVVDRHAGRLLVLDASGRLSGVGSRQGWEPGLLLLPAGIVRLPDGLVLVADEGNGRAQLFRRTDRGASP